MNTAEFLTISAAVVPDREALVSGEQRISYAQMQSRVIRLANALQSLGVGRGAAVAVMAVNCPQYVEAYYACAKLGAVFVPLNYRAKHEELDYMVNASEAKALLFGERYLDLVSTLRPKFTGVREYVCIDGKPEGMHSYDGLLLSPEEEQYVEIDENDASILMYTSGTTAQP